MVQLKLPFATGETSAIRDQSGHPIAGVASEQRSASDKCCGLSRAARVAGCGDLGLKISNIAIPTGKAWEMIDLPEAIDQNTYRKRVAAVRDRLVVTLDISR